VTHASAPAFDHFEIHVVDVPRYCAFLAKAFQGGRHKVISESGTAMFISPEGLCIEVKRRKEPRPPAPSGLCNPCLRMKGAKAFIEKTLGFSVDQTVKNPDGEVYFFVDHEGVTWHMKDYDHKDRFVGW
jgi:hypothetical protein